MITLNNKKIRDIKKIKDNENLSYLITIFDDKINKTFLITYIDNYYEIKSITNLIAYVEKYNIVFEDFITPEDISIIYDFLNLINTSNINDKNVIKKDNIDNQYYDEEIKLYKK